MSGNNESQQLTVTDDLLIRYLLGELQSPERMQLAERSFLDDELFDRLLEAENDLVDRYVAGTLTGNDRDLFEKTILKREPLRQKVAVAVALRSALMAAPAIDSAPSPGDAARSRAGLRKRLRLYRFAAAAALLVAVVGAAWLIRRNLQSQQARTAAPAEQHPAPIPRDTPSDLARDSQQPSTGASPSPQQPDRSGAAPGRRANSSGKIAAFVLLPGSTRSSDEPQILKIPATQRSATLELQLNEGDDYPAYRVILRTAGGAEVLRRAHQRSIRLPFGRAVAVELGVGGLAAGQYEAELVGLSQNGVEKVVNYYYFTLSKN